MTSLALIASGFLLWDKGYDLVATILLVIGLAPATSLLVRR
jgi:hypothetical protein